MIINLLSSPRNVSTALMYSFAQRSDTTVIDEPFYGYYLEQIGPGSHPGGEEIVRSMPSDYDEIIGTLIEKSVETEHLFLKNMTHHFFEMKVDFMRGFKNVIFLRNPSLIITSFARVIPNPSIKDIGVKLQLDMFKRLKELSGDDPIVVDSHDLLSEPEAYFSRLCAVIGIPFDMSMLSWPAGARKEDGMWARFWYENVHKSTGFSQPKPTPKNLPSHLKSLYEEALPYYVELSKHALKI